MSYVAKKKTNRLANTSIVCSNRYRTSMGLMGQRRKNEQERQTDKQKRALASNSIGKMAWVLHSFPCPTGKGSIHTWDCNFLYCLQQSILKVIQARVSFCNQTVRQSEGPEYVNLVWFTWALLWKKQGYDFHLGKVCSSGAWVWVLRSLTLATITPHIFIRSQTFPEEKPGIARLVWLQLQASKKSERQQTN